MPHNIKLIFASLTFFVLSLIAAQSARADTVFVYTGTGNGTYSSGASGTGLTGGVNSTSPNGQLFREVPLGNSTATLTINGLAANSMTTLTFNLYGIQSLDGNGESGGGGPDAFRLTANGGTLLNATFSNVSSATQTYNGTTNTGNNPAGTGRSNQDSLGYTAFYSGFGDTTYSLSFNAMTNASGSITLIFAGLQTQATGDESFGIDNIMVNGTPAAPSAVPEPTTMLLLGTGLAGVMAKVRKRRKGGN